MSNTNIVLSYSAEYTDLNTTFIHAYYDYYKYLFTNIKRSTLITENKIKITEIEELLTKLNDFLEKEFKQKVQHYQLCSVDGIDHDNYESDESDDNDDYPSKNQKSEEIVQFLDKIYVFLPNGIGIYINQLVHGYYGVRIGVVDAFNLDLNKKNEISNKIFNFLKENVEKFKKSEDNTSSIHFICTSSHGGFYLNKTKIEKNKDINLEEHYNDDFIEVSRKIEEKLKEKSSTGIILLHGKHGTGKTSYLRHLIHTVNKKILYVPPNISGSLSEPSFLTFLMKHKNSVLIIEDAENVIKTRESGENQAVSNLLNVTDGILGDGLNFQVICTFNTGFEQIDPALKRKGRMIAQYEFGDLTPDKTKNLVKKLYGDEIKPEFDSMSLAEIYNMQDDNFDSDKAKKRSIGFLAEL